MNTRTDVPGIRARERQTWAYIGPQARMSLRRMYLAMRRISCVNRPLARTYCSWAAQIAYYAKHGV